MKPIHQVDLFLGAGLVHEFPTDHARQEAHIPALYKRILEFQHGLEVGDLIFVGKGIVDLQGAIIRRLCNEFNCQAFGGYRGLRIIRLRPPT